MREGGTQHATAYLVVAKIFVAVVAAYRAYTRWGTVPVALQREA